MSFHPTIELYWIEVRNGLYKFLFDEETDDGDSLDDLLITYEAAQLFECRWNDSDNGNEREYWTINAEGMHHLIPHFANWDEMYAKATGKADEQPQRENATYSYRVEFFDKDGNAVPGCYECGKVSKDNITVHALRFVYCTCNGKTWCASCYEQHQHVETCHTCSSTNIYKFCQCHTMPLCHLCYQAHMDEEQRKHRQQSQHETVNIKFSVHDDASDALRAALHGFYVPPDYVHQREAARRAEQQRHEAAMKAKAERERLEKEEMERLHEQIWEEAFRRFSSYTRSGQQSRSTSSSSGAVNTVSEAYSILGVSMNATQQEVKKAYKKKAREAHPDTPTGTHEQMVKVNRAYEIVSQRVGIK